MAVHIATRHLLAGSLLLCLTVTGTVSAQDVITIAGVITTRADGGPVADAVVSVVDVVASAMTDASGRYSL